MHPGTTSVMTRLVNVLAFLMSLGGHVIDVALVTGASLSAVSADVMETLILVIPSLELVSIVGISPPEMLVNGRFLCDFLFFL